MMVQAVRAIRSSVNPWLLQGVPDRWDVKRLKYCARLINEKVDGRDSELPYTGLEHVESWTGRRIPSDERSGGDGQASRFRPGDVLFGKLRPYLAKVLRAAEEGVCTGELLVLRPRAVIQDFLFYFMLAPDFIGVVDASTYGAKMPRASWDFIGNQPVLVPPEDEQRAIAAFLDRETARIDALIAKKERQIELLQEKRTAVISHAVTRGLDPNVKMKDSGIEWLGEIPQHWTTIRLKYAFRFISGGTPPTGDLRYWNGDLPWVSPKDMKTLYLTDTQDHITEGAVRESATDIVPEGAVLLVMRSGILRHSIPVGVARKRMAINQDLKGLIPRTGELLPEYFARFVEGYQAQLLTEWRKEGATVESLEYGLVANFEMLVPPCNEQRAIAAFLDRETARIDALIGKLRTSIDRLREYRTALISAAVTGKIDVRKEAA